jgi:hypothetical protein
MSISMKNVSERDLRKLQKKGYAVSEVKKPEVKIEDKIFLVVKKTIDTFINKIERNTETAADLVEESKKQTDAIVSVAGKETPKKKFELIPERNKQGYIQKITIQEI